MKTTCPQCANHIKIDPETHASLTGQAHFACPACQGLVPVPVLVRPQLLLNPAPGTHTRTPAMPTSYPQSAATPSRGPSRNLLILGAFALLVLGGTAFVLASREPGDTHTNTQNIRYEIINNSYFHNLIATGVTTMRDLNAIAAIRPFKEGFIGISAEPVDWSQAQDLARRTGAEVLDVQNTTSKGDIIAWLEKSFSSRLSSSVWVRDYTEVRVLDGPDVLDPATTERPRNVLLQWGLSGGKLKALIVDGQNNHQVWPKSTVMMKQYLEDTGLFDVEVARTKFIWSAERETAFLLLAGVGESVMVKNPKPDPDFKPNFSKYAVVISNFGWKAADWPEETQRAFEEYVKGGGGFVSVHAADNSWGNWTEFNKMIALGGWGDRTEKDGPFVYYNNDGEIIRDTSPGNSGKHGPQNEFVVTIRNREHPVTKGLPDFWLHARDECYSHLRGPAQNLTILATACDSPELKAAGRHEPILMTVEYDKGRVFHTTLGHDTEAFEGVGFITTFLRGTEWAASGKVTQKIPTDFPSADKSSARRFQPARFKIPQFKIPDNK